MGKILAFFAAAPQGVEPILEEELRALGAAECRQSSGGVHFAGTYDLALKACLWSRTAVRILLPLARFPVAAPDEIYEAAGTIPWEEHLAADATMAVNFSGRGAGITNTMFGAQRVKDAVTDRLRRVTGRRPSVDTRSPDFRINCHLSRGELELRVDLSGDSLHQRSYRTDGRLAPLKENLASALLIKAGWPSIAGSGGAFMDPLCGSGTLVIEAALIASDSAPGLLRDRWGFQGWKGHDGRRWDALIREAGERREQGMLRAPRCTGFDNDPRAVAAAIANARQAGVDAIVHIERRSLDRARPGEKLKAGLLLTNPPYGKRLGDKDELKKLYAQLGDVMKQNFQGWSAAVFTGEPELGKRMGLKARKVNTFHNGPLLCQLLLFYVEEQWFVDRDARDARNAEEKLAGAMARGADAFMNRLKKNLRTLHKWAEREGIDCYRVYDADLPEYAVAVDRYGGRVRVREYAPPKSVDLAKAAARLEDAVTVITAVMGVDAELVTLVKRKREREERPEAASLLEVREGARRFLVDATAGDTGLALERRTLRDLVAQLAPGRRILDLWCRAGTVSVSAALAGAAATVSVDPSSRWCEWARKNQELNGLHGADHRIVRDEPLSWIRRCRERFGLILLDLPRDGDGAGTIAAAAALLDREGLMIACAGRGLKDEFGALPPGLAVRDITEKMAPRDSKRKGTLRVYMIADPAVLRKPAQWKGR